MSKNKIMHNIAIVANTSWSIYNFRLGLLRALKDAGFSVIVIAPYDGFSAKFTVEGFRYVPITLKNYGINPFQDLLYMRKLSRIYKEQKVDFIFHYTIKPNIYGSIAAKYSGIPSIAITTGLGHLFDFKNGLVKRLTFSLYKYAAKISKEIWFLNDSDRDVFVYKNIVSKEKCKVIYSEGVDLNWFKRNSKHLIRESPVFLFAGRLLMDKGVDLFIKSAAIIKNKYPEVKFQILGFINQENPNSIPYEKIVKYHNLQIIEYLGETEDVREVIENADCLVFPSYYREGASRILMEAAALETPIITTNNVGCKTIVDHDVSGYICEPQSLTSLVMWIESFINLTSEDRLIMGKMGRKKVEKQFDEKEVINKYIQTLNCYLEDSTSDFTRVSSKKIEIRQPQNE